MIKPGTVSQGKASVIWRASHSAVGLVVTPIQKATASKPQDDKHEQSFECQRRNDEEIHGCNPVGVVAEKSLPPLRRRTSPSQHVFRNRRLGDIKAELEQLAVNPRRAPKRIFLCTYGARDLGVLDQSRAGRLDCEISSATRRENPSGASESLSQDARSPWRCRYRGNADTTRRTTPDHRGKAATFSEPFGAECSADGEG